MPGLSGPNVDLKNATILRNRSHDLFRNNAWIKRGIHSHRANEVGTGFTPRSLAPDDNFRKEAKKLWDRWVRVADANQTLNFHGLVGLCVQARKVGGEQFIRRRLRSLSDDLPVPMQLELLSAEYCPIEENRNLENGRKIRLGIELDRIGRRRAYWFYTSHPSDPFDLGTIRELVAVPADSVIHHFQPLIGGQLRGLPDTIQSLIKSKDFDEYDDAELERKKKRAAHTGVLRRQAFDQDDWQYDPFTGKPLKTDDNGTPLTTLEPGTFLQLLPGEDITLFDGDVTGQGYKDFVRQQLLGISAGLDMPYEILSGDYAGVNDRILRFIVNEWRRKLTQDQWHLDIPQICERVWEWFIDLAVLIGALEAKDYATRRVEYLEVEWRPDGWEYIHPEQDINAKLKAIAGGLDSRQKVLAERGESAEEIDQQNAEDKNREKELGLNYSSEQSAVSSEQTEEDAGQDGRG
jgi:lambda family phage portal protein